MIRFIIISLIGGLLFGIPDGLINANSLAHKFLEYYKYIAKQNINVQMGLIIDGIYGFVMYWIFLLIYISLPSENGLIKGFIYGIII